MHYNIKHFLMNLFLYLRNTQRHVTLTISRLLPLFQFSTVTQMTILHKIFCLPFILDLPNETQSKIKRKRASKQWKISNWYFPKERKRRKNSKLHLFQIWFIHLTKGMWMNIEFAQILKVLDKNAFCINSFCSKLSIF